MAMKTQAGATVAKSKKARNKEVDSDEDSVEEKNQVPSKTVNTSIMPHDNCAVFI